MTKIKVEFYKEVRNEHGCDTHMEKATFLHECRPNTPYIEDVDAAFSEAVERGHNPIKNIRMTAIARREDCKEPERGQAERRTKSSVKREVYFGQ